MEISSSSAKHTHTRARTTAPTGAKAKDVRTKQQQRLLLLRRRCGRPAAPAAHAPLDGQGAGTCTSARMEGGNPTIAAAYPRTHTPSDVPPQQPWVEKFRPHSVDDIAHQDEAVKTLKSAIQTVRAYVRVRACVHCRMSCRWGHRNDDHSDAHTPHPAGHAAAPALLRAPRDGQDLHHPGGGAGALRAGVPVAHPGAQRVRRARHQGGPGEGEAVRAVHRRGARQDQGVRPSSGLELAAGHSKQARGLA